MDKEELKQVQNEKGTGMTTEHQLNVRATMWEKSGKPTI